MASKNKQQPSALTNTLANIMMVSGLLGLGFGVNAIFRPDSAVAIFQQTMPPPDPLGNRKMIEELMLIYGIRDVYMGLSTILGTLVGGRKTGGLMLLLTAGVAAMDGYAVMGHGEWQHWGYVPLVAGIGAYMLVNE